MLYFVQKIINKDENKGRNLFTKQNKNYINYKTNANLNINKLCSNLTGKKIHHKIIVTNNNLETN